MYTYQGQRKLRKFGWDKLFLREFFSPHHLFRINPPPPSKKNQQQCKNKWLGNMYPNHPKGVHPHLTYLIFSSFSAQNHYYKSVGLGGPSNCKTETFCLFCLYLDKLKILFVFFYLLYKSPLSLV